MLPHQVTHTSTYMYIHFTLHFQSETAGTVFVLDDVVEQEI